jgi:hypothetical protein
MAASVAEDLTEIARELQVLEAELKRLETEYNLFFGGRLPRPPWETRSRVENLVKRLDRTNINNTGERFRFSTLQSRFSTFADLWDRGLRSREEGRPGPFAQPRPTPPRTTKQEDDRILHVTTMRDPLREMNKLHELYDQLVEARKNAGKQAMPFHQFAELVKTQVSSLKGKGSGEIALRVAVRDGKIALTAKPLRGGDKDGK